MPVELTFSNSKTMRCACSSVIHWFSRRNVSREVVAAERSDERDVLLKWRLRMALARNQAVHEYLTLASRFCHSGSVKRG